MLRDELIFHVEFSGTTYRMVGLCSKKQLKFVPFSIVNFDETLTIQVLKSKLIRPNDSLFILRACITGNFQGTTEQTVTCIEKTERPFLTGTLDLQNFHHTRI